MSYSIIRIYAFRCDEEGCDTEEDFVPRQRSTWSDSRREYADARRLASAEGWRVDAGPDGDRDICPTHRTRKAARP